MATGLGRVRASTLPPLVVLLIAVLWSALSCDNAVTPTTTALAVTTTVAFQTTTTAPPTTSTSEATTNTSTLEGERAFMKELGPDFISWVRVIRDRRANKVTDEVVYAEMQRLQQQWTGRQAPSTRTQTFLDGWLTDLSTCEKYWALIVKNDVAGAEAMRKEVDQAIMGAHLPETLGAIVADLDMYLAPGTTAAPTTTTATTTAASSPAGATAPLSSEERQQLDSLDAAGVIRTYFETSDPRVVYYLSTPHEQAIMTSPNYVGEQRHGGDISNLTLAGPTGISPRLDAYPLTGWPTQEQFVVQYDLLVARERYAQEAGPQMRFVYVGKQTPDSPWRVMGVGTGP